MKRKIGKNRILILGASGFLGNILYRELSSYFEVYGTYFTQEGLYSENNVFSKFSVQENSILTLLNSVEPTIIISALKGDFASNFLMHQEMVSYVQLNQACKILFLSSVAVFDGNTNFPSYEKDKTVSESAYGKNKISLEKLLLENLPKQIAILRIPIVLGYNSPKIVHLRQTIKYNATFDVFPNLIVTVTTATKFAQQIHYIINQELIGIFHLASDDMIHHDELFKEITEKISNKIPIFKNVYDSNNDKYFALLPKFNKLPSSYAITVSEVITESTFNDEISTLKKA